MRRSAREALATQSRPRAAHESRTFRRRNGGEVFGKQTDDDRQNVMDKTNAAPDPAHRARVFDPIAKWRIGCRAQALGLFGGDDDRLKLVECPGQTGTAASLSRIQSKCE